MPIHPLVRTALVSLSLAGSALAQMGDPSRLPLPGAARTVVNGHALAVSCQGKGATTVVLLSGGGVPAVSWAAPPPVELQDGVMRHPPFGSRVPVQLDLARDLRVCVYDRPGLGSSDPLPDATPRSVDDAVSDLHGLLGELSPGGPVVLVGHSMGGLIAFEYARTHPGRVAGLVLVDAAHPDERNRTAWLFPWNASRETQAIARGHEHLDARPATTRGPVAPGVLGSLPLVVLTRAEGPDTREARMYGVDASSATLARWRATSWGMAAEYAAASSRGELRAAARSGHFIPFDRPELVSEAVRDVLRALP